MSRSSQILIVEDEPNIRLTFRTALASNDYLLSTAEDGETALRSLADAPADLILLDLQMPGMGGMEMLRRLRAAGNGTPVVIISAHDGAPNVVQAMKLGAIDFLSKPLMPDVLRRVVAEVLARHAAKPAAARDGEARPATTGGASESLILAKQALNRREFDHAESFLRRAIAEGPRPAEAHYLMGVLHELRDERHAAYGDYRAALRADPEYEPAKFHLMKYYADKLM